MKRYSIDQNYSELIEEGGEWYRAIDFDQLQRDHDALLEQVRGAREALENGASKLVYVSEYECQDEETSIEYRKDAATLRALAALVKS